MPSAVRKNQGKPRVEALPGSNGWGLFAFGILIGVGFFFNDTAPTEIYTLSLHDALPIYPFASVSISCGSHSVRGVAPMKLKDRKSTRLNSSHRCISYAVFCLKKKYR